jgi:hypothetical protein
LRRCWTGLSGIIGVDAVAAAVKTGGIVIKLTDKRKNIIIPITD